MRLSIVLKDEVQKSNGIMSIKKVPIEKQPSSKTIINCSEEIESRSAQISDCLYRSMYEAPFKRLRKRK